MKRSALVLAPFVSLVILASAALAQQAPPGGPPDGPDGNGPPPGQRENGPRPARMGGGGMSMGPGGGQRDGGPDGMGMAGQGRGPMGQIQMLRGYIDLVESMSRLAKDADASGVAAVISAGDVLKPRGPDAAIDYFNKLLPDAKSQTVQRAIRIQLIDLYKASGQQEKALEQVRMLTTDPGSQLPTALPAR